MKKVISFILAAAMLLIPTACGGGSEGESTYEIALVTDTGNIDDKSFNEGSWTGVREFAEEHHITYAYYRPTEDANEARLKAIDSAITKGAKVIVCPGHLFEDVVYQAQKTYPQVMFLLLDGEPHDQDQVYETTPNTHCIVYQEEQAGYLAGYAAVREGYTKLGFCGGMALPAVIRYGYGFLQGAEAAGGELGLAPGDIQVKYWYSNSFLPSDDARNKMDGWYTDGTQVVFACGGKLYQSVIAAAESAGGKVIGVDVDQADASPTVITSAAKELARSVKLALTSLYENGGTWGSDQAGQTLLLGAADLCVGLPTGEGSWRFENFTVEEYEALFTKLASGEIPVDNSSSKDVMPVTTICVVENQGEG